jgi:hypothetical protein
MDFQGGLRMKKLSLLTILGIGIPFVAKADISNSFRNTNAVVLYEFRETTGPVLDTANPAFGEPLNLSIYKPTNVTRVDGTLEITGANVIRSDKPAAKIVDQCKQSGALSFEVWLENNETVEKRAGLDAAKRPQPLRILSLSKSLFERNFIFGQFYDMGNVYATGIVTSSNEPNPASLGNSLTDPLLSTVSSTRVPETNSTRVVSSVMQKIVVTLGPTGLAKLYLSDRNGYMYLAKTEARGFGTGPAATYFSKWDKANTYLTLGNESMSPAEFATALGMGDDNFQTCTAASNASNRCFTNPNRYWKGKLHKVAVYCSELSRNVVLGDGTYNVMKNAKLEIDLNTQITPLRKRAQEIHSRLTGIKTPISNPILGEMESLLNVGDSVGAAAKVTSDPSFINITVRDFAAKMSNRDETINLPLNDFTATVVGIVRDERNAQTMLTDDITYQADLTKAPVPGDLIDDILRSNNHYEALTTGRYDLSQVLVPKKQKLFNGTEAVNNPSPSGLLSSRQWMAAHAIAGTNRRLVEYAFRQFTCQGIENVADASGPDNVIARDIDRFPGGSHSKFTSSCRACHTIMDGFRPAFAQWTFSNGFAKHAYVVPKIAMNVDEDTSVGMKMEPDFVTYKLNKNATVFSEGNVSTDDKWVNNATRGTNAELFKWKTTSGKGLRAFGQALSETAAFPRCMAERVFKQVCKRKPASSDNAMLTNAATEFSTTRGFNLKFLFEKIVTTDECLGGTNE